VTEGLNVGDLDGDGRPDLVVGGDESLIWFRNPAWTPRLIAGGYKYAGGAAVMVGDLNDDGRLDVIVGRYPGEDTGRRETVWMETRPGGWVAHTLSSVSYCHDMAFGDLDGDGRPDLACADLFRDEISWLRAPADPTDEWTTHTIESGHRSQGAAIADID